MNHKYLFITCNLLLCFTLSYTNGYHTTDRWVTQRWTTERLVEETTVHRDTDGYYYIEETNHYYNLHDNPQSFEGAKQSCINEGATMFVPEGHREIKAVLNFWQNVLDVKFPQYLMLGSKRPRDDLTMLKPHTYVDTMFHNWDPNLPINTSGSANCMQITYRQLQKSNLIWVNAVDCDGKRRFMCRK